jgi:hypothetical protein
MADLNDANLKNAVASPSTTWPTAFDPKAAGVVVMETSED